MASDDSQENKRRHLLAIRAGREGFGWPAASPWTFSLSDNDVLRILEAPGLPVHRSECFREATLVSPEGEAEFSEAEANIGFAGAAICRLRRALSALDLQPDIATTDVGLKRAERLLRALVKLEELLDDAEIVALLNDWNIVVRGSVPLEDYRKTTSVFSQFAGVTVDGIKDAIASKRWHSRHPEGEVSVRFIRYDLAQAFEEIYRQPPTKTRPNSPFQQFAQAFYAAASLSQPAMETIIRALTTKSRRSR